jgi:serine/threonine protein kinase
MEPEAPSTAPAESGIETGSLVAGTMIDGRYEILAFIGKGGMCEVYRARHLQLDKSVAIKILQQSASAASKEASRFRRESQAIAALKHPNIVSAYGFGMLTDRPYLAIELLDGESLASRLARVQRLDKQSFVRICAQICDALGYAHQLGVIHRDVKPNNVMITDDDDVRLVDFGISKFVEDVKGGSQKLTQTGQIIGTVLYMSPEQSLGQRTDARSDIYSLGCLMYELLVGKPPFDADTPFALLYKHGNEPVQDSPYLGEWAPIIFACLQKEPNDRPQTAAEVKAAICDPSAEKTSLQPIPKRRWDDNKKIIRYALVTSGLAAVILGAALAWKLTHAQNGGDMPTRSETDTALILAYKDLHTPRPDYRKAATALSRLRPIVEKTNSAELPGLVARLCFVYMTDNQDAEFLEQSRILKNLPDNGGRFSALYAHDLSMIGDEWLHRGNQQEAIHWYKRSIAYVQSHSADPSYAATTKLLLGDAYYVTGKYSEAERCLSPLNDFGETYFKDNQAATSDLFNLAMACSSLAQQPGLNEEQHHKYAREAIAAFAKVPTSSVKYRAAHAKLLELQKRHAHRH